MNKVSISFEADTPAELQRLVMNYALERDTPSSLRAGVSLDGKALQADAEAREAYQKEIDEDDAEYAKGNGADPEPEQTPEPPAKRARAARAPRVSAPAPDIQQEAAKDATDRIARHNQILDEEKAKAAVKAADLPPLDTLKAIVTNAVRLAQKGEGSKTILDLLPAFREATGLQYIMNSEDKHRTAL